MRIIAVDDEPVALTDLKQSIEEAAPGAELFCFPSPQEALTFAEDRLIDVAFLDVKMGTMDGISLALCLKKRHPKVNIVFVTGYSDFMGNAFSMHASGYVHKPVRTAGILRELEDLRHPVAPKEAHRVRMKCFGSFEVFIDGKLLMFSRSKPKELLAYLVGQQGSSVSAAKIAAILWEDKIYNRSLQKQTQTVISQLMAILRDAGIEEIICKSWNSIAVDTSKIHCDYYDFLHGDVSALNAYTGEYMSDYSWAEFTTGLLTQTKLNR